MDPYGNIAMKKRKKNKLNQVFEIVAVYNPTEKEEEDGKVSVIVVEPKTVLAKDERTAGVMAARAIPQEYESKLDQVEVLVRPF